MKACGAKVTKFEVGELVELDTSLALAGTAKVAVKLKNNIVRRALLEHRTRSYQTEQLQKADHRRYEMFLVMEGTGRVLFVNSYGSIC